MNSPATQDTVFVIDDDVSFLRSVSRLLRAAGYTVQTFETAPDFLARLSPDASGCVVTDLQMPGCDGLELQTALAQSANPLPVIFLSAQGDIPTTVRAMRGGAEDFLTKLSSKEELLGAVNRALARQAQQRRQREQQLDLQAKFESLTAREREVLGYVVRGKLNKQIASELGINLRTVKMHRTNLTRRLQVQSVAELTRLAAAAGII